MRFDSNAVEMTTAKHYMYLTKFCELLACQCYSSGELTFMLGTYKFVLKIILTMTSQIYKNCIIQNKKGRRSPNVNHIVIAIQVGLQQNF